MAKGIRVIETNTEFENLPKGNYFVKGFEFIGLDDNDQPYFQPDDYKGMSTKIRFINVIDNQQGPPMSVSPAELVGLVHLFGATDFLPNKENRTLPSVMLAGMKKANEAGQSVAVEVNEKGWVRVVNHLRPPEGKYTVKFSGTYPQDGSWFDGKEDSQYLYAFFGIVGETVWEGFSIRVSLGKIFADYYEDENGTTCGAIEDEMPAYPDPAKNLLAKRWTNFGTYFCNNIWERHDWQVDPAKSQYGICEVIEPQKVLFAEAKKAGAEVIVWFEKKEKSDNWHFELADLGKFNEVHADRVATIKDFVAFVKSRTWFHADDTEMDISEIFKSEDPLEFVLNEEEKSEWGRRYLKTAWEQAELSLENNNFDILTAVELGRLMSAMESLYGEAS